MEADFAVELGAEDATLEMPWSGGQTGPAYYDLKRHPEFLTSISEAIRVPELGEFLSAINSATSLLETAKCDTWSSTEMNPEEEIFRATHKFGGYVDLVFSADAERFSFEHHERFSKCVAQLLKKAPHISAFAEFLIRRCFYHLDGATRDGFYLTFYLFGYADDEQIARQRWAIALNLSKNALKQAMQTVRQR
jgi:hypothetical protein